ncbi:MAG: hypothetical protein ACC726_13200 [Chloroflexota bacterium]
MEYDFGTEETAMTPPGASSDIRELRESAEAGGDWYLAPDVITPGHFLITVACAPFGESSWTAYEVVFDWDGADHAAFVFDISGSEGISPGSSSPWDGWIAWAGPDLLVAWSYTEDWQLGSIKIEGGSAFGHEETPTDSPKAWAELARTITLQLMR